MACATCGAACAPMRHDCYEGDPRRPARTWSYIAALYHRVDKPGPDGRVTANFCGAACSAAWP
jgi:hypothetical protein